MTSACIVRGHGLEFRIGSSDREVVAVFDDLLVDMRGLAAPAVTRRVEVEIEPCHGTDATDDDGTQRFRVRADGGSVYDALAEGSLVSHVLMEVNRHTAAALWSSGSIPLHASSVRGPSGAVVVAGPSHSGKTTLAAALATDCEEVDFLADEVSAVHPVELTVAPYGKPAALRPPGLDLLVGAVARLRHEGSRFETAERFVPPSELGQLPSAPVPASAIVFPRFDPAAPAPHLDRPSPGDALARLMHLTLAGSDLDVRTFRSLERLVRSVDLYDVTYANVHDAVTALRIGIDDRRAR